MNDPELCFGGSLYTITAYAEYALHTLAHGATVLLWSLSGSMEVWTWSETIGGFCRLSGTMV